MAGATLLGCFIHGAMRSYIFARDSLWAAKTTPDDQAIFKGLPEGAAQVKIWQADQLLDMAPQAYTVTARPGKLDVQLNVVPRHHQI